MKLSRILNQVMVLPLPQCPEWEEGVVVQDNHKGTAVTKLMSISPQEQANSTCTGKVFLMSKDCCYRTVNFFFSRKTSDITR